MEKQYMLACVLGLIILVVRRASSVSYDWCDPCTCSEQSLSCVQRNLREINIVNQLPSVIKVSFVGNEITTVRANDFLNVNNLQVLDLTFNEIRAIDNAAFRTLTKATRIDVSFNKIEHVAQDTFDFSNRLEYLLMEENYISDIDFISGIRNCSLIELNLSFNTLTHIKGNTFSRCRAIENLQLSDNYIEELDPQSFDGLNQLRVLNLGGNKLKTLTSAVCPQVTNVRSQVSLEKLDLSRNFIGYIPSKAFTNCSNLRTVLLNYNEIYRIEVGAFSEVGVDETTKYDIHVRDCTSTLPTFMNSSLTYVDLSHNVLSGWEFTDTFQHLKYLSYLDLSHNVMRDFSPSLICLMIRPTSKVIVELEENNFQCNCGILYEAYLLSKKYNLTLNVTCSSLYYYDKSWDMLDAVNCDSSETRVRYVVIFSLVGLTFIVAVILIFARLYYVRTKAAREINPDL